MPPPIKAYFISYQSKNEQLLVIDNVTF